MGEFIKKVKGLSIIIQLSATLLINACSNDVKAPTLNRPQDTPYAACTEVNLDLQKLTESSVRTFVDCLNGTEGRIQAYKDLLDALDAEEIKVLLHIYNTHMVDQARFKKALELYNQMLIDGQFDKMMRAFAAMADTGVLRNIIPLFKNLYGTEDGLSDPAIESLNQFLVKLIERDQLNDSIITLAKFMDNGRSHLITKMISMGSYLPGYDRKKIVEDLSNAIYYGIQTGGFKEIAILLYDPTNFQMFKDVMAQSPGGLAGINSYFEYLSLNSTRSSQLTDLSQLTRATNVSADCFTNSGDPQRIDNLFHLGFEEVKSRKLNTQEEIAEFYIEEVPFHLQNLNGQCSLPTNIRRLYPSFIQLLEDGYGQQLTAMEMGFDNYGRLSYLTDIMSSYQISSVVSSIANTADRHILAYFLDMLTEDLDQNDYFSISQIVNYLMLEDLESEETTKFIRNFPGMKEGLKQRLLSIQEPGNFGLVPLLQHLDGFSVKSKDYNGMAAELRRALGKYDFVDSPSSYVLPVIGKLVSPNGRARQDIEKFVDSLLVLWEKEEAGMGEFISAMAMSLNHSVDRPIQEFIRDVLSDKDFVKAINPLLLKLVEKEAFLDAIDLTADLGRTGELSRLFAFLHSLTVNLPLESLDPEPLGKNYTDFNGDPNDYIRDYTYRPTPLLKDYTACKAILSADSNWNSNYVRNLALCFSAKSGGDLDQILDLLESIVSENGLNALDILAGFVSNEILSSAHFYPLLNSLERNYYSGNLDKVFDLLLALGTESSDFIEKMESLVAKSCKNKNNLDSPQWLVGLIQEEGSEKVFSLLPKIIFSNVESSLPDISISPLGISSEDLERAAQVWDKYKEGLADQSWRNDEQGYIDSMLKDYQERTDNYYYGQEVFENPSNHPEGKNAYYINFIRKMMNYASRGDSVVAIVQAMKNLEESSYPWLEFLDHSTGRVDLIPYYIGKTKEPYLRFASPLERAEILVQNSRISVAKWVPGLGVGDVGTHFQIELAKSSNNMKTLKSLDDMIGLGLNYTKVFGRKRKRNNLKNIDKNFGVLIELEEKNYLRFFAEIYKQLYIATPKKERKQDRDRIYTSLVHEPMKLGIFSHLSRWYLEWKQNNLHIELVESLLAWLDRLSLEEVQTMQEVLKLFTELDNETGIVANIYEVIDESDIEFSPKENLTLLKAFTNLPGNMNFLKPILLEWKKDPSQLVGQFQFLLNTILLEAGELKRLSNLMTHFGPEENRSFSLVANGLGQDLGWVLSAWKEFDYLYRNDKEALKDFILSFRDWRQTNEAIDQQSEALEQVLFDMTQNSKPVLKAFLEQEKYRKITTELFCEIADQKKTRQVIELSEDFRNSKGFENVFEMLRKYFK